MRAEVGSVFVRPGPSDRLECRVRLRVYRASEAEARRYLKSYQLSLRAAEGSATLSGGFPHGRREHVGLEVDFEILVPVRFNLDLETDGGNLEVERLEGEIRAVTAGGDIRTGDVTGPLRLETAGGGISLGNIGQRVEARTAGGNIRVGTVKGDATLETSGGEIVAGRVEGAIQAQTAGGDIVLQGSSGPVVAQTAGGQIQLGEIGSSVRAQTAGGSIRLHGARGLVQVQTAGGSIDLFQLQGAVQAATAAGRILAEINADRKTFAASKLETSVGDVQVYLPPDLACTIDAVIDAAAGHKIISDFALTIQGDEEPFPPRTLRGHGALQGGGELLRIHTTMGNIEIRKLNSQALEQLKLRQKSFWKRWEKDPKEVEEHREAIKQYKQAFNEFERARKEFEQARRQYKEWQKEYQEALKDYERARKEYERAREEQKRALKERRLGED